MKYLVRFGIKKQMPELKDLPVMDKQARMARMNLLKNKTRELVARLKTEFPMVTVEGKMGILMWCIISIPGDNHATIAKEIKTKLNCEAVFPDGPIPQPAV